MFAPEQVRGRAAGLWRYTEALGLEDSANSITLGEGITPLVRGELSRIPVLFKLDYLCPTGSFKDRGSAVMISKLREWGVREIVEDSSGNAGAAVAAYAAAAGIRANIFIPQHAAAGKAAQIATYGANLVRIPGTREDTSLAALEAARRSYYASHNWNPYFVIGLETLAFEITEQLGWKAPDWLIAPVGGGGLILGLHAGFAKLLGAGLIRKLPRLVGVQAEQCAPVFHAWAANLPEVVPVKKGETAAEGISIAQPIKGRDILKAVRASDGLMRTVSESAIWDMLEIMGRKGIYIEPTSAAAPAAAAGLAAEGLLQPNETTVIELTGIGLKATDKVLQHRRK
jgi:threonine synthase